MLNTAYSQGKGLGDRHSKAMWIEQTSLSLSGTCRRRIDPSGKGHGQLPWEGSGLLVRGCVDQLSLSLVGLLVLPPFYDTTQSLSPVPVTSPGTEE
jgi:hypothetical protein